MKVPPTTLVTAAAKPANVPSGGGRPSDQRSGSGSGVRPPSPSHARTSSGAVMTSNNCLPRAAPVALCRPKGRLGHPYPLAFPPQPVGRVHSDVTRPAASAGPSTRPSQSAPAAGPARPCASTSPGVRCSAIPGATSTTGTDLGAAPGATSGAAAGATTGYLGATRVPKPLGRTLLLGSAVPGLLLQHREPPAAVEQ